MHSPLNLSSFCVSTSVMQGESRVMNQSLTGSLEVIHSQLLLWRSSELSVRCSFRPTNDLFPNQALLFPQRLLVRSRLEYPTTRRVKDLPKPPERSESWTWQVKHIDIGPSLRATGRSLDSDWLLTKSRRSLALEFFGLTLVTVKMMCWTPHISIGSHLLNSSTFQFLKSVKKLVDDLIGISNGCSRTLPG